jgi:peptidoglycan/xylan/chitin deacetylase (PgdA/CDA1 family)
MLNPSQTNTAHITIRYYSGGGALKVQTMTIAPMHRGTSSPGGFSTRQQVSIQVESDIGLVVERPMYVNVNIPTAGGATTGAASAVGATGPSGDWLFAEGYTGTNFQEYLVIANVTSNTASVNVKLEYTNGTTQTVPVTVSALRQVNFDVNNAFAHPQPGSIPTASVSAEVTSTPASLVVERVMYFHFGPKLVSGVTDVVGEAGPASHTLYTFAEGFASTTFDEFLTLQNPTDNAETVNINLYTTQLAKQVTRVLQPYSRSTESINGLLSNPGSLSVSMSVQSSSGPIVAERPMYFTYGSSKGGTDVIGFTGDPGQPPCSGGTPVSSIEIDRGNTSRHQIALTFDAGGENAPAASILNTLNTRGVHATWFFTGEWAQQNPVVTKNVGAGGYLIGNHTMTHPSLTTIPNIDICRQLNQANQTITALTGRSTTRPYYRPPYGARDQRVWDVTASIGYRSVYWTLDTLDWQSTSTPDSIIKRIQDFLNSDLYGGNGAIILMHAGSSSEAQALNRVIDMLQGKGFQLGTINEILQ